MKKILVLVFSIGFSQTETHAQQLARIANGDSYLNIRARESSDSKIIGSFQASEFFYVQPDSTNWWKAKSIYGKEGFVYRGRVQLIDSLPEAQLRNLFSNVFENEKELAENYSTTLLKHNFDTRRWQTRTDSIINLKALKFYAKYSEEKFYPVLDIYVNYFCRTADSSTMILLFGATNAERCAQDGEPNFILARCFLCHSDLMLQLMSSLPENTFRIIHGEIEFGISNANAVDFQMPDFSLDADSIYNLIEKLNSVSK